MKALFFIWSIVVFISFNSWGQTWQDIAREGSKLYKDGKYEEAYETLLEAQKLAPKEIDLSSDIGNAAYRSGDFETAEKAFRASSTNPGKSKIELGEQWHNVGNSQFQKEDFQAAIESYKNALRMNPNDEKARYNLAEARRRIQQQQQQEKEQQQSNDSAEDQGTDEGEGGEGAGEKQNDEDESQNQNTPANNNEEDRNDDKQSSEQLSDRKTDRILEDLLKQEMETTERVREMGARKENNQINSGKRW